MRPPTDHDHWDELAAGYALHALEPDEEAAFLTHLDHCPHCAETLIDHTLVAAQLGSAAADTTAPPPAWADIRPHLLSQRPPTIAALERRRQQRGQRLLAAAAAVVIIAGVTIAGWQAASGGGRTPTLRSIGACQRSADCQVVPLHASTGSATATALIQNGRVRIVPAQMHGPGSGHTYALWQLPRDGAPRLVSEFQDVNAPTATSPLPSAFSDTAAFAISRETDNHTPSRPSDVVLIGSATRQQ
ncbi:MAG TPA: anti-sigma factor [Mycobacteriales bacterium]|jgi:anti-sigma-K factor RskA|nr:anti-sigma factor [Mycobacteriales bacterium]